MFCEKQRRKYSNNSSRLKNSVHMYLVGGQGKSGTLVRDTTPVNQIHCDFKCECASERERKLNILHLVR